MQSLPLLSTGMGSSANTQQRAHWDADAGLNVSRNWQVAAAAASAGGQHEAGGGQQAVHVLCGQPVLHAAAHEPIAKGVEVGAQRHHCQAVTRVLQGALGLVRYASDPSLRPAHCCPEASL